MGFCIKKNSPYKSPKNCDNGGLLEHHVINVFNTSIYSRDNKSILNSQLSGQLNGQQGDFLVCQHGI